MLNKAVAQIRNTAIRNTNNKSSDEVDSRNQRELDISDGTVKVHVKYLLKICSSARV